MADFLVVQYTRLFSITFIILILVWIWVYLNGFKSELTNTNNHAISFNWHLLLMSMAFVLLMTEGAAAFRYPTGAKLEPSNQFRMARRKYHLILNSLAIVLAIVGTVLVFVYHVQSGYENLSSAHSWLGVATLVLVGGQWLAGFYLYWFTRERQQLKKRFLPWHQLGGKFIVFLSIATMAMGFFEYQTFQQDHWGIKAMGAGAFVLLLLLLAGLLSYTFAVPLHGVEAPPPLLSDSEA